MSRNHASTSGGRQPRDFDRKANQVGDLTERKHAEVKQRLLLGHSGIVQPVDRGCFSNAVKALLR